MAKATIHPKFIQPKWINDPERPGYARKTFILRPEVVFWFHEHNIMAPYDVKYEPLVQASSRYEVILFFANDEDAMMFKLTWNNDTSILGYE